MAKMMTRLLTIALVIGCAAGFTVPKEPVSHTYLSAVSSRRAFLDVSLLTGVGLVVGYNPAFAEDAPNDLVMPTEAEQQKIDMEERLRRKAELQKQASRPKSFQESLKGELDKQKKLEKSKEERRNALCEELGRGC